MKKIFQIVDRIKTALYLDTDGDVAEALNMSNTALSNHKRRGSIPYEPISTLCEAKGLSFDWLLTGEGPKERGAVKEPFPLLKSEEVANPTVAALAKKLEAIYEEGNRKDRGEVRGLIDEIYDDLKKNEAEMDEEEPLKKTGNH